MKTCIYFGISILILSAGCQKNNDFDGIRPDTRLNEKIDSYYELLTDADNGWVGYLYPNAGGGHSFKLHFDAENRVTMFADLNDAFASTAKESSYRIKAAQVPSLYFDTYSYIHVLADPDPNVSGGTPGRGRFSDFEFSIVSATRDSIRLLGNVHKSEMLLVRADDSQGDNYMVDVRRYNSEQLGKLQAMSSYYKTLEIGDTRLQMIINPELSSIRFMGVGQADTIDFFTAYAPTGHGIQLRRPLYIGGTRYEALDDFNLNVAQGTGTVKLGNQTANLVSADQPLVRNPQDATNMHIATYQYRMLGGVRKDGQQDVFGFESLPGYSGLFFIPRRYLDGTDVFYLLYNQGQNYLGPAVSTQIGQNGVLQFDVLGYDYNDPNTVTVEVLAAVDQLIEVLQSNQGYYVFRTGQTAYDLVSVQDPGLWMRLL